MSSNTGDAVAERQRDREGRGLRRLSQSRGTSEGPRQRRPALAALALLLIVGGALGAGLLALRMDSREPVIVAREDIPPGVQITEDMLAEAQVATDTVPTIPVDLADQVVGAYSTDTIAAGELVPERALAAESPVADGRAVVGVNLTPGLTYDDVKAGDLVRIFRIAGAQSGGGSEVTEISQGLVLTTATTGGGGDLGGGVTSSTASVLVPAEVAGLVVDASGAGLAGLALTSTGQPTDVDLVVAEGASGGFGGSGGSGGSTDDTDGTEDEGGAQ